MISPDQSQIPIQKIFAPPPPPLSELKYCTKCGHVGKPDIEEESRFSDGWGLFLLLLGIIPGIVYWLSTRSPDRFWACRNCRGRECLVPTDSPVAVSALARMGKQ